LRQLRHGHGLENRPRTCLAAPAFAALSPAAKPRPAAAAVALLDLPPARSVPQPLPAPRPSYRLLPRHSSSAAGAYAPRSITSRACAVTLLAMTSSCVLTCRAEASASRPKTSIRDHHRAHCRPLFAGFSAGSGHLCFRAHRQHLQLPNASSTAAAPNSSPRNPPLRASSLARVLGKPLRRQNARHPKLAGVSGIWQTPGVCTN